METFMDHFKKLSQTDINNHSPENEKQLIFEDKWNHEINKDFTSAAICELITKLKIKKACRLDYIGNEFPLIHFLCIFLT